MLRYDDKVFQNISKYVGYIIVWYDKIIHGQIECASQDVCYCVSSPKHFNYFNVASILNVLGMSSVSRVSNVSFV